MASASPVTGVEEEVQCPICMELLADPVTLDCGRITDYCDKWEDLGDLECPVCRDRIKGRTFRSNWQLAKIAENLRHKKNHLCVKHKKELNLFCKKDDKLLCVACWRSPEHQLHTVLLLEEAAQEYKENIQAQLPFLEKEKLMKQKETEEQRSQKYLNQVEEQKLKITSDFKEMHNFLEEKECVWLMQLADLEKEIKEKQEENMTRLSKEISHFSDLIKDVEEKCQQAPSEFLQDIRRTLSRCQEGQVRQRLELSPGLESRLRSCCSNSAVLEKARKEFEKALEEFEGSKTEALSQWFLNWEVWLPGEPQIRARGTTECHGILSENSTMPVGRHQHNVMESRSHWLPMVKGAAGRKSLGNTALSKVSVTLDPDTAHRDLILSEDLKTVRCGEIYRILLDNPERFDTRSCVLGRERFTSGRHCWEVEANVEEAKKARWWAVGVARESLTRKGCVPICPREGIWAVRNNNDSATLWAYTNNINTRLTWSHQPRKIRVFLDYEEGHVMFFDADTDDLIFTFPPASFSGEVIRPFLWVGWGVCLHCCI